MWLWAPGRLIDHLKRGTLNLEKVSALVLDEADEMLRMGFIEDVETIMEAMPKERITALFSRDDATAHRKNRQAFSPTSKAGSNEE